MTGSIILPELFLGGINLNMNVEVKNLLLFLMTLFFIDTVTRKEITFILSGAVFMASGDPFSILMVSIFYIIQSDFKLSLLLKLGLISQIVLLMFLNSAQEILVILSLFNIFILAISRHKKYESSLLLGQFYFLNNYFVNEILITYLVLTFFIILIISKLRFRLEIPRDNISSMSLLVFYAYAFLILRNETILYVPLLIMPIVFNSGLTNEKKSVLVTTSPILFLITILNLGILKGVNTIFLIPISVVLFTYFFYISKLLMNSSFKDRDNYLLGTVSVMAIIEIIIKDVIL
mgnify:CR=1 FL=1